jgi:hypothetical protein
MCVPTKAAHKFDRQTTTNGQNEIVVTDLALDGAVERDNIAFIMVKRRDLGLHEFYPLLMHGLAEVKKDIRQPAAAKRQTDKSRKECELIVERNECDLMFRSQSFRQRFSGDYTAEATAQNKHACHDQP